MPLTVLKRHSAIATMFPPRVQRVWVLAFHDSYGRAVTLPHFTPVTIARANYIKQELEQHGVWTDTIHCATL